MDDGVVATLRCLAQSVDSLDERPTDNVTFPTYLKFCDALGLTPAGRLKLGDVKESTGGKLARLRAVESKPKRGRAG